MTEMYSVELTAEEREAFLRTGYAEHYMVEQKIINRLRDAKPMDRFEVDWSKAPPWAMYHTEDARGIMHWHLQKPVQHEAFQMWIHEESSATCQVDSGSLPKCPDWRESLRRRPRGIK
jgi:hypothetical protein